ncbi:MAG: DPP IV N-terminal domain-containing protein, partial [Flavobacteriaceae bacterium]|nr:DPP IV N-terminal domain-containing protein [Flavobacteriaceae bacterium]
MKKIFLLFLIATTTLLAQKKDITLEDIWINGTFRTEGLESFHAMGNGDFYTILNHNQSGTYLDKYDYATLKKAGTIVSGNDLAGIKYFDDYTFSEDETKLIIGINLEKIYRHSQVGKYYIYHLSSKKLELISDQLIQEPTFSP